MNRDPGSPSIVTLSPKKHNFYLATKTFEEGELREVLNSSFDIDQENSVSSASQIKGNWCSPLKRCLNVRNSLRIISSPSIFYLVRGIEIFNVSPMVGLTYFFAFGVVDNDAWELGKFLIK